MPAPIVQGIALLTGGSAEDRREGPDAAYSSRGSSRVWEAVLSMLCRRRQLSPFISRVWTWRVRRSDPKTWVRSSKGRLAVTRMEPRSQRWLKTSEEQFRPGAGQGDEAQLVDDQQAEEGKLPLQVEQPPFVPGLHQLMAQGGGESHRPFPAGRRPGPVPGRRGPCRSRCFRRRCRSPASGCIRSGPAPSPGPCSPRGWP